MRIARGHDMEAAAAHLARRDRKLGSWMRKVGVIDADPRWRRPFDVVDALARAILYQQLAGKAAALGGGGITGRGFAQAPQNARPLPDLGDLRPCSWREAYGVRWRAGAGRG